MSEADVSWLRLRWWGFWLRRCPECGERGYYPHKPRWADDRIARMLGVAHFGCPCCGKGAIAERDALRATGTCPTSCMTRNHPGREHDDWAPPQPDATPDPVGETSESEDR